MKLDYVISACGLMGVFEASPEYEWFSRYKTAAKEMTKQLKHCIKRDTNEIDPIISGLYNGYTEKGLIKQFASLENIGYDSMYADSGGLQIVTAGKSVTEDIKKEIYKRQAYSDYAMCFDVIPVTKATDKQTRNERSNYANKIYHADQIVDAGHATGKNIKTQIDFFRRIKAKTKVVIIVQGNSCDDMVKFFNAISNELEADDYEYVGGLALAQACLGSGEAEAIEALRAAHLIGQYCHDNIKNHLHILGVGSIARMRPVLYLYKSGYLGMYRKLSFDSSSHTSTFIYGLLKLNGTCKSIGSHKTKEVEDHFRNVYRLFEPVYGIYVSEDEFITNVFGDELGADWKFSTIKTKALEQTDVKKIVPNLLANLGHTYYQIHNFMVNMDKLLDHNHGHISHKSKANISDISINNLLTIHEESDMIYWMNNFSSYVKSKRIKRASENQTLAEFM